MGPKIVDFKTDTVYPLTHNLFYKTGGEGGSKAPAKESSPDKNKDIVDNVTNIIEAGLDRELTEVEVNYTTGENDKDVKFILFTIPGEDINLHVYDESGRHVGFDVYEGMDVVEIPGSLYSGSELFQQIVQVPVDGRQNFTVKAELTEILTDEPKPVIVSAIETPKRPAIIALTKDSVKELITPAKSNEILITLAEVGGQENIKDLEITASDIISLSGAKLEAELTEEKFDLNKSSGKVLKIYFNVSDIEKLSSGKTSFKDTIIIKVPGICNIEIPVELSVIKKEYAPGWNTISIPVSLNDGRAYKLSEDMNSTGIFYVWNETKQGYDAVLGTDNLEAGKSYWSMIKTDSTWYPTGKLSDKHVLRRGWNMFGGILEETELEDVTLRCVGGEYTFIEARNNNIIEEVGVFDKDISEIAGTDPDRLEQGSYFIKLTQDCVIGW